MDLLSLRLRKTRQTLESQLQEVFREERRLLRSLRAERTEERTEERVEGTKRPQTRGDCVDGPRPCPWVSCRHHLALDVRESGSLRLHPAIGSVDGIAEALEAMDETCALDVAARGGLTLWEVGALLYLSAEWVRQVEEVGLDQVRDHLTTINLKK